MMCGLYKESILAVWAKNQSQKIAYQWCPEGHLAHLDLITPFISLFLKVATSSFLS